MTSLAAVQKGVTCNCHLSSFDAGAADEGSSTCESQGSIPSADTVASTAPLSLAADHSRRVMPLPTAGDSVMAAFSLRGDAGVL